MKRHPMLHGHRSNRGMSLIEVLIAVLILAIGLLGVAALQATALRNAQGSLARSQAVMESYAILDSIRAAIPANAVNDAAAKTAAIDAYDLARTCDVPTATATLADNDRRLWMTNLHAALGATACGTINCVANVCTVTVEWDETRATGGAANYSINTVSQL